MEDAGVVSRCDSPVKSSLIRQPSFPPRHRGVPNDSVDKERARQGRTGNCRPLHTGIWHLCRSGHHTV